MHLGLRLFCVKWRSAMFLLLWACSSEHTLNFFAPGQSYAHKVVRLQVVVVHGSVYFQITFLHDISQHCTLPTNTPTLTHLGLPAIPDPVLCPNIMLFSMAHCYSMMSSPSGYWLVILNLPKIKFYHISTPSIFDTKIVYFLLPIFVNYRMSD